ncbi:heavy metal translocating P-type ATPase [uncultured Desulfosarcina sp.]|uniref:heavy metal translocating P-type ATPase n=1 Tax=uncultured Desulfosarcina sp. TaxID=218289 RepID=UPI0029C8BCB2|nr:heavy metal translocating P-type ATPase [uncultured Desulfosarcina sp.]
MSKSSSDIPRFRIVHELAERIRIHFPALYDPLLDNAYFQAVVENLPGVRRVRINGRAASVVVEYDGSPASREKILTTLRHLPSDVYATRAVDDSNSPELADVFIKGALTLAGLKAPLEVAAPLSLLLGLPVIVKGVDTFFNQGVKVETLDAAAVGLSLARGDFFTSNSIVTLLAMGEYLEASSENRSTELLKSLLRPQVEHVWVQRNGEEIRIPIAKVVVGDKVVCGPGDIIPVDGTVEDGEASVNQSSITGESVSVHLFSGREALSGSVVEEGRLVILAEQVGSETSMARITRFMENSLRSKSESQTRSAELADKLVPVTLALGTAIFLLTGDIARATAVLTVDYSCAIKLANPVAVKTAMYDAAKSGVLVKGAQALDALAGIDTLVLDKTGTLTNGVLQVTDVVSTGDLTADALLALAAAAEQHYAHPVAHAVMQAAQERGLELPAMSNVDYIVAHGVSAYVEDQRVLAGSLHFLQDDEGVDCSGVSALADRLRREGNNLLYISRSGVLEGVIAFRDDLRPEAPAVLRGLKATGIRRIVVLTGDHRDTAQAVIGPLDDVSELHWEMKPEDKSRIVKELKDDGCTVAFVGDGVNDAPAMITAQVGICMPDGSNLAKEAAMVLLLEDDLEALLKARQVATQTRVVIENCFKSAVGFNSIVLLMATLGVIPAVASALLHNMSTVSILGYAALSNRTNGKR